ncbi:uncharacterized protein LOC133304236 [Gastrolobium bilobum]|uniref:uncharacterized protein LOC133304236 n=1 Tax=Gastrolobium bilobum TaxID=150636 RepID=UPI002AB2DDA2|nr:uncharacterized protein LOC133304236 [Gastrolobium bilobum]
MAHKNPDEWLKDMRGNLSLVATVISTMTFQTVINPPGGVMPTKDNVKDVTDCTFAMTNKCPGPGEAILAVRFPGRYERFLVCNTICFISSLSVCLLLVSGIPLNHRCPIWLLSIGMCITITSLALTYLYGMSMVTPDSFSDWDMTSGLILLIWFGLLGVVALLLMIRFFDWCVEKWNKKPNDPQQQREG